MSRDSDIAILGRAMNDHKKLRRRRYGVACPMCCELQPNRDATILIPQQRCKVDGYRDPRPSLTEEQEEALWEECGFGPSQRDGNYKVREYKGV